MSLTIVFSWESGLGEFASWKSAEIQSAFRSGILVTARDVPFKILVSVEAVGSATRDRAFDISLVRLDVFAAIVVSFDVSLNIENRVMTVRLPHHTYLSSCRWE